MNIERNFLENANNIVAENSFKSRKEVKRSLIDKLFLGSRIYFVIRYMMIILKIKIRKMIKKIVPVAARVLNLLPSRERHPVFQ